MTSSYIICDPNHAIFGYGGTLCALGMLGVLIVFAQRLHFTFVNTEFALSKKLKYYTICCICFALLLLLTISILYIVTGGESNENGAGNVASSLLLLFMIGNAIFFFTLFVKKLNLIVETFWYFV